MILLLTIIFLPMKSSIIKFVVPFMFLLVGLTGCTNQNAPSEIAKKWLDDYHNLDFEDAKKYSTETTRNTLSLAQLFLSTMADSLKRKAREIKVDIKGTKIDGDNASVIYTLSRDPKREETLKLIKQNNVWLVQFSKLDMNAEGAHEDTTATQPIQDSSVQITVGPPDTAASSAPATEDTSGH